MVGPAAEEHYREAVERIGRSRMSAYLARTHLVFGEWLRREGRRQAARQQLRTAHDMLLGMVRRRSPRAWPGSCAPRASTRAAGRRSRRMR
jgi:hypothetical protein